MIQFADRSTMIVPEAEGKLLVAALGSGKSATVRGAHINPHFVSIIKPIEKGWFKAEFVEQQNRIELSDPQSIKLLPCDAQ